MLRIVVEQVLNFRLRHQLDRLLLHLVQRQILADVQLVVGTAKIKFFGWVGVMGALMEAPQLR